jgi:cellulose biosynthesis protein BcsQ
MSKCRVIPVANQKGSVSKTTSVRNLAYSLAELGYRVLTVDYDPQSNLTGSFVLDDENNDMSLKILRLLLLNGLLPFICFFSSKEFKIWSNCYCIIHSLLTC